MRRAPALKRVLILTVHACRRVVGDRIAVLQQLADDQRPRVWGRTESGWVEAGFTIRVARRRRRVFRGQSVFLREYFMECDREIGRGNVSRRVGRLFRRRY